MTKNVYYGIITVKLKQKELQVFLCCLPTQETCKFRMSQQKATKRTKQATKRRFGIRQPYFWAALLQQTRTMPLCPPGLSLNNALFVTAPSHDSPSAVSDVKTVPEGRPKGRVTVQILQFECLKPALLQLKLQFWGNRMQTFSKPGLGEPIVRPRRQRMRIFLIDEGSTLHVALCFAGTYCSSLPCRDPSHDSLLPFLFLPTSYAQKLPSFLSNSGISVEPRVLDAHAGCWAPRGLAQRVSSPP